MRRTAVLFSFFLPVALAGCSGAPTCAPAGSPKGAGDSDQAARPAQSAPADDLANKIAAHPFWAVKVSRAEVDGLVAKTLDQQGSAAVFVDDRLTTVPVVADNFILREAVVRPPTIGERCFYIDLRQYKTRPDRETILRKLMESLDEADFHAPKKKPPAKPDAN
jgi:hypothetical protein